MTNRSHIFRFPAASLAIVQACMLLIAAAKVNAADEVKPKLTASATADFLALHVAGTAPQGTGSLRFRWSLSGEIPAGSPWNPVKEMIQPDGAFTFDIPLKTSRWAALELQAIAGDAVIAQFQGRHVVTPFKMLTPEKLAMLPPGQREEWDRYLQTSREKHEEEFDVLAAECRELVLPNSAGAPLSKTVFESRRKSGNDWFTGAEAGKLADSLISFQTPSGGWSKAVDYSSNRERGMQWTTNEGNRWHYCGTIDNNSTTEQIRFLARVFESTQRMDAHASALKGIEWILAAQYPNGGWPQNYPVESGYHEAITLNDNAMIHVLELLRTISRGESPFAFIEPPLRERASAAYERGLAWLLKAQVKVDGALTVWGAQHDPLTLEPVAARKKEPPSLSGLESAEALRFLMRNAPLTDDVKTSVEAGIKWFDTHRITNLRLIKTADGKIDYVEDPNSKEVYWARFYDVQTAKPLFAGAEDGIIYGTFSEMAAKNKVAYDYLSQRPAGLFEKEVPMWRKRLQEPAAGK